MPATPSLAALFLVLALATPARAESLRLTEADSGKSFSLRAGDEVEVRLGENASTGFVWSQQENGAPGLKQVSRSMDNPDAGRVGAPGMAVFRYRAATEGVCALTLRLARGWEKNTPPARTFSARFGIRR